MVRWIIAGYLVVEIAAFWALVHFLGFGWALLITLAASALGFAVLGRRVREFAAPVRNRAAGPDPAGESPVAAFSDSALLAVTGILTVLPGIVTTVLGLILTASPVRRRLRPVVAAGAARKATLLAEKITVVRMAPHGHVDGSVVDGSIVDEGRVRSDIVDTTVRNPDGSSYQDIPALPEGSPHDRTRRDR